MRVVHPTGFSMQIPDNWNVVQDPSPEVALIALAPPDETGFSRNIVVTLGQVDSDGQDMAPWHEKTIDALFSELEDPQLIDVHLDQDSFRRIISYVGEGRALTLEQWVWLWERPDRVDGVTISSTTPTLMYAEHVDEATTVAWSWDTSAEGQK